MHVEPNSQLESGRARWRWMKKESQKSATGRKRRDRGVLQVPWHWLGTASQDGRRVTVGNQGQPSQAAAQPAASSTILSQDNPPPVQPRSLTTSRLNAQRVQSTSVSLVRALHNTHPHHSDPEPARSPPQCSATSGPCSRRPLPPRAARCAPPLLFPSAPSRLRLGSVSMPFLRTRSRSESTLGRART